MPLRTALSHLGQCPAAMDDGMHDASANLAIGIAIGCEIGMAIISTSACAWLLRNSHPAHQRKHGSSQP